MPAHIPPTTGFPAALIIPHNLFPPPRTLFHARFCHFVSLLPVFTHPCASDDLIEQDRARPACPRPAVRGIRRRFAPAARAAAHIDPQSAPAHIPPATGFPAARIIPHHLFPPPALPRCYSPRLFPPPRTLFHARFCHFVSLPPVFTHPCSPDDLIEQARARPARPRPAVRGIRRRFAPAARAAAHIDPQSAPHRPFFARPDNPDTVLLQECFLTAEERNFKMIIISY